MGEETIVRSDPTTATVGQRTVLAGVGVNGEAILSYEDDTGGGGGGFTPLTLTYADGEFGPATVPVLTSPDYTFADGGYAFGIFPQSLLNTHGVTEWVFAFVDIEGGTGAILNYWSIFNNDGSFQFIGLDDTQSDLPLAIDGGITVTDACVFLNGTTSIFASEGDPNGNITPGDQGDLAMDFETPALWLNKDSTQNGWVRAVLAAPNAIASGPDSVALGDNTLAYSSDQVALSGTSNVDFGPGGAQSSVITANVQTAPGQDGSLGTCIGPTILILQDQFQRPQWNRTIAVHATIVARRIDAIGTDSAWTADFVLRGAGTVDGQDIEPFILAPSQPSLPVVVTEGVNDQFSYTPEGEATITYTVPPGTYESASDLIDAVNNSTASDSSQLYAVLNITLAGVDGNFVGFSTTTPGPSTNGSTMQEVNGAFSDMGFSSESPAVFAGGITSDNSYSILGDATPTLLAQDDGASTWSVAFSTGGNTLQGQVSGDGESTINWACTVELTEVCGP